MMKMNHKMERRLLAIFAVAFVCTFLVALRNSLQTPEVVDNSEEVQKLMGELERVEKVLLKERKELNELDRKLEAKLRSHPRAKIHKMKEASKLLPKWTQPIPVLVFVCNRPEAVKEHLNKLIRYRRGKEEQFPIIISQDCDNRALQEAIKPFTNSSKVQYIKHISSETARIRIPPEHKSFGVYYKIARHYKLALDHVFLKQNHTSVIITEDDLDIAPDFFEYFLATRPLLEFDDSLFCVSAWNDNGKAGLIDQNANSLLYRTDFFPGLGWMMTRNFWQEIGPKWPTGFWDDFIREPEQRMDRSCIRPEISRTAMTSHGKSGASRGLFFNRHLRRIILSQSPFEFTKMDLSNLSKPIYDAKFLQRVYSLRKCALDELVMAKGAAMGECRVEYGTMGEFVKIAQRIGIMADTKAGVPRTAYLGVVSAFFKGNRLFLAPVPGPDNWPGYDRRWEAPREILDGLQ